MKLVKNFAFAVLLASILAVSAFAGEQSTPGVAGPSPIPTPERVTTASDRETCYYCNPDSGSVTTETSDCLLFEALAALLSVY
jgi:hypothetical protein